MTRMDTIGFDDETAQRSILLIIGGGIAAYKSLDLIRECRRRDIAVTVLLTEAAKQFVTPLAASALSGTKTYDTLFSLTDEVEMGHIELSRSAALVVVAPATADLMAKMAQGLANDLASTTLLATDKPVLIAPAMNVRMWLHPATQRNIATLKGDGLHIIGPDEGEMACGEFGPGRMAEPRAITEAIEALLGASRDAIPMGAPAPTLELAGPKPLAGLSVLVTSGPTHEPIDPVRFIANRSSGKQGHAIAAAAAEAGARVTLVSGPVTIPDPPGCRVVRVETAAEMARAVERALPADIAVFAAAVADWRVAEVAEEKIKKGAGTPPALTMVENQDILASIAQRRAGRPRLVVGFAAETEQVIEHARGKLARKGCDLIVANDVSPERAVMGGEMNLVHLVSKDHVETWPKLAKGEVGRRLIAEIARLYAALPEKTPA